MLPMPAGFPPWQFPTSKLFHPNQNPRRKFSGATLRILKRACTSNRDNVQTNLKRTPECCSCASPSSRILVEGSVVFPVVCGVCFFEHCSSCLLSALLLVVVSCGIEGPLYNRSGDSPHFSSHLVSRPSFHAHWNCGFVVSAKEFDFT